MFKTIAFPHLVLLAFEVNRGDAFGSCLGRSYHTFSVWFFFTAAHVERIFTSQVALIPCFGFSLIAGSGKLALRLFLIFEERSSYWIYGLIDFHFLGDICLNGAFFFLFLLFFRRIDQLLFKKVLFFIVTRQSLGFVDERMETMLHPSVTFAAVHALRTVWCLDWLYFIEKIPMWTLLWFVTVNWRFSSVVLNIVSIGAFSSIVTE